MSLSRSQGGRYQDRPCVVWVHEKTYSRDAGDDLVMCGCEKFVEREYAKKEQTA